MTDSWRNPLGLFDVAGKVALITGASGAFGAVAAKALAGAGCRLVLAAGNADALSDVQNACQDLGAEVVCLAIRFGGGELHIEHVGGQYRVQYICA